MSSPKIFYTIGGKYEPEGLNKLKQGLANTTAKFKGFTSGITNAVKPFSGAIGGITAGIAAAGAAIAGIKKIVNETSEIFLAQNKQVEQLNIAISQNANLTEGAAKRITSAISKIPSIFDEDEINKNTAYLTSLGLTEKQITDTMKAAMELDASGVMPLDTAVKTLSQSFKGNIAQLKKICPEVANLTEEQIKEGQAVESVMQKYNGYVKKVAQTYNGLETQHKNAVSNLKASWGGFFVAFNTTFKSQFTNTFQDMATNIDNIRQKIEPVIKYIAQDVANKIRVAFESIRLAINVLLTPIKLVINALKELKNFVADKLTKSLDNAFEGKRWWAKFKNVFSMITKVITHFPSVVSETLGLISNLINKTFEGDNFKKVAKNIGLIILNGLKIGWTYFKEYASLVMTAIGDYGQVILTNVKYFFVNVGHKIWNSILGAINSGLKGMLNTKLGKSLYNLFSGEEYNGSDVLKVEHFDPYFKNNGEWYKMTSTGGSSKTGEIASFSKANELISQKQASIKDKIDAVKLEGMSKIMEAQGELYEIYGDTIENYLERINETLGLNEDVARETATATVEEIGGFIENTTSDIVDAVETNGELVVTATENIETNSGSNEKQSFWGWVWDTIKKTFMELESVNQLVNAFQTILKSFMEVLEPIINDLLLPLVDYLKDIGQKLGEKLLPIMESLADFFSEVIYPIIDYLAELLEGIIEIIAAILPIVEGVLLVAFKALGVVLEYVILPVFNALAKAIEWVANGFIDIINNVIKAINGALGWLGVHIGYLNKISLDTSTERTTATASTETTSRGSASYQAARDIIVNICYEHSYVNGDTRAIALNIRDEIREAEKLGY